MTVIFQSRISVQIITHFRLFEMKFNILRPLIGTNKFYSSFKYSRFATIDDSDLKFFESLLGKSSVRTNDIDDFNTDFMKWYRGRFSI